MIDPWVRKIPWRRIWQPTPVFLPGKFHGQAGTLIPSAQRLVWAAKQALVRCARPSGVPRGPATSTGSLASQRHPGMRPSSVAPDPAESRGAPPQARRQGRVWARLARNPTPAFLGAPPKKTTRDPCSEEGTGGLTSVDREPKDSRERQGGPGSPSFYEGAAAYVSQELVNAALAVPSSSC